MPQTLDLTTATIDYEDTGGPSPVVLFVHGLLVDGTLWRKVVAQLDGFRCVVPTLPLGSHRTPVRDRAALTPVGVADMLAELMERLELTDVTIVANDTGGAVAQWLVGHRAERVGRLVLTSCDAFEKFPPAPQRYLPVAARTPGLLRAVAWLTRFRAVQRLPTAYGWTTRRPIEPAIMRSYTTPVRTIPGVRRDLARLLRAVDTRHTHEAAAALRGFDAPALVLWAAEDRLFPLDHGRRLAELLPQGRFETVAASRTFIPEEQPDRLVARLRAFLAR